MRRFPLSYGAAAELVPLMRAELDLCRVRPGDIIAIHADYQSHPHYPAALLGAALSLSAHPYQLWTTSTGMPDDAAVQQAWEGSDLIIDLRTGAGLGATQLAASALRAGRRVLAISEPVDVLMRLIPDAAIVERTRAAAARLAAGESVYVTSAHGADLRFSKAGRPGIDQHGYSERPGRWDRWPSSRAVCAPIEDSAGGRVVVAPGDLWLSLGRYAETPVALTFAKGRLTAVDGSGPDGLFMRDWFERPADAGAHVLAAFSWGCDPRARWQRVAMRFAEPGGAMEAASLDGAVMLVFGDNTSPMMGGRNVTAARFAIALRDQTVTVDGDTVVERGRTV